MSHEGVILVWRAVVLLAMVVVAAFFRALIGRGRRRDLMMLAGTLGGTALSVSPGSLISH